MEIEIINDFAKLALTLNLLIHDHHSPALLGKTWTRLT